MSTGGNCKFTPDVTTNHPWLVEVPNDPHSGLCTICNSVFSSKKGITFCIKRHVSYDKHKTALKRQDDIKNRKQLTLPLYAPSSSTSSTKSESEFKEQVLKAECYHVLNTVIHNHSFMSADTESSKVRLSSLQFPDSSIAKRMAVGQTTCTYLMNALA